MNKCLNICILMIVWLSLLSCFEVSADSYPIIPLNNIVDDEDFSNGGLMYLHNCEISFERFKGQSLLFIITPPRDGNCGVSFNPNLEILIGQSGGNPINYVTGKKWSISHITVVDGSEIIARGLTVEVISHGNLPYGGDTIEEVSQHYGFDVTPYVYPNGIEEFIADLDNDFAVTANDASLVLEEYAYIATGDEAKLKGDMLYRADINGDGIVDAIDASLILEYYTYCSTTNDTPPKTVNEYFKGRLQ